MKRKVEVSLLGQKFAVRSEKDEAYVHALASYVTGRFEELKRQTRTVSTHHLALLVALNIADELFQLEEESAELRTDVRERTEKLLYDVQSVLSGMNTEEVQVSSPGQAVVGAGEA